MSDEHPRNSTVLAFPPAREQFAAPPPPAPLDLNLSSASLLRQTAIGLAELSRAMAVMAASMHQIATAMEAMPPDAS